MRIGMLRWIRPVLKLEVHELASLGMLIYLVLLYQIGLENESILDEIRRVSNHAGPITKTISVLLIVFLLGGAFVKKRVISEKAFLMCRIMLSFLVMLFSFEAVTHFLAVSGPPLYDEMLQNWDRLLFFGKQPAEWLEHVNNAPLTLFLSGAYLFWFAVTYGTIFFMMLKGKQAVLEYATTALTTFYIGYIFYVIVPAYGPVFTYTFATPMGGLTGMMTDRAIFQPVADAFPSLHTGIAVIMAVVSKRFVKKLYPLYAIVAFLIIVSTVYLRIHYAVDVIAGIVLAVLTTWACPRILKWWEHAKAAGNERMGTAEFRVILKQVQGGQETLTK